MEKKESNAVKKKQGFAIASMVSGVFGLLLFMAPHLGIVLSILAIVFSRKQSYSGFSTAGMVLGIIGICINGMMLLMMLVVLMLTPIF